MTDIFISYKREDRAYARKLAEFFAVRGYEVWWDVELLTGANFSDEILSVISSAKSAIVLWTPESVESQWVRSEATEANERGILLPVLLQPTSIPMPFNMLNTLDLTKWHDEPSDALLGPLLSAVEQKLEQPAKAAAKLSAADITETLARPRHEVEFWTAITQLDAPTASDYELYLSKYGEKGTFSDIAQREISRLSSAHVVRRKIRQAVLFFAVVIGIVAAGVEIAKNLGFLDREKVVQNGSPRVPERKILERYPEVIAKTIMEWSGGSRMENCVPPLNQKAGYILVGGELQPGIRHAERVPAGCFVPGTCDSHNEFCTTVKRSKACYVNEDWYDWKVTELAKTAFDITYDSMCM